MCYSSVIIPEQFTDAPYKTSTCITVVQNWQRILFTETVHKPGTCVWSFITRTITKAVY